MVVWLRRLAFSTSVYSPTSSCEVGPALLHYYGVITLHGYLSLCSIHWFSTFVAIVPFEAHWITSYGGRLQVGESMAVLKLRAFLMNFLLV